MKQDQAKTRGRKTPVAPASKTARPVKAVKVKKQKPTPVVETAAPPKKVLPRGFGSSCWTIAMSQAVTTGSSRSACSSMSDRPTTSNTSGR